MWYRTNSRISKAESDLGHELNGRTIVAGLNYFREQRAEILSFYAVMPEIIDKQQVIFGAFDEPVGIWPPRPLK